jgi:D-lactate dehydrogenase
MTAQAPARTTPDDAPEVVAAELRDALRAQFAADQLHLRPIDLAARAHDASHVLLVPDAVVTAQSVDDVVAALRLASTAGRPVTFRSGGTSLSGQASGTGLQVDTRAGFRDVEVLDGGRLVRCGPGATIRSVNARLAPYRRRLGPDPASEVACTVGGVVANNSSGMACGTEASTYATLDSLVVVLPSGTVLDTAHPDADARLLSAEPALHAGLLHLRDRVRRDPISVERIRHLFSMKNTMGYSVNAFLDHDTPVAILEHLLVGSEGTLGFVAQATFRTVPVLPLAATGLLVFATLTDATDALGALTRAGARTLELMDAASLRVVQPSLALTDPLRSLVLDGHTALLLELQAEDAEALAAATAHVDEVAAQLPLVLPVSLTVDPAERAALWTLRKGLYTAVAGARPVGTTALLEDVVVPVPALSATMTELDALFARHGYDDAVVFGHAKDGNLHFMISPRLDDPAELRAFEAFTEDLVELVLRQGGSLKAEHGTGRVMAPFVERQYGPELFAVMTGVKELFDPERLLNPGVVLPDSPRAHLEHLKLVPQVDPRVDACVECGYCEPVCPSKDITVTPRQRIVLLRTMAAAGPDQRAAIEEDFGYDAVDLCAADSLCVTACPVGIDTGKVMKSFRAERAGRSGSPAQRAGDLAARHWGAVGAAARAGLAVAAPLPGGVLGAVTAAARSVLPHELVPSASGDLPGPGSRRRGGQRGAGAPEVVLFPSCVGGIFAAERGADGLLESAEGAFVSLCDRAGASVVVPDAVDGLCCGTVWQSKGLTDGHRTMAHATAQALWETSDRGRLPVVTDASSCTHGLRDLGSQLDGTWAERFDRLRIVDAVTFVREALLARLTVTQRLRTAAVHPTCSTVHLGIVDDLVALAGVVASEVLVPPSWGCCGFAGDRGMLHPELTASATAREAAEVAAFEVAREGRLDAYASANRTCEMGMSRATGRPYVHVLQLLERATRP